MAAGDDTLPAGLMDEVAAALAALEQKMGKRLGDDRPAPRVGAVRCAVLDAGDDGHRPQPRPERRVGRRPGKQTGNERFAYDSYRRFVQMFGKIVLDIPGDKFEHALEELRDAQGVATDPELSADLAGLVETFKGIVKTEAGIDFPQDPKEQLRYAIEAVFKSWNGERARVYRRMEKIPDDLGTAVNVQTMVFGNKGDDSGTGVAFTRDPATGENRPYGDFLTNAQGEDVVAGIRVTEPLDAMANDFPECHQQLLDADADAREPLPRHVRHRVHDRAGPPVPPPDPRREAHRGRALRMAVEMEGEGLIDQSEAVLRVQPAQLDQLLHPQFDPGGEVPRWPRA